MVPTENAGLLAATWEPSHLNGSNPPITVSVVVPTYKEAANIEELVERVTAAFDQLDQWLEIIIVDDASRDGTDQKVAELQRKGRHVRMIERTDERGLSSAVLRGFDEAKGQYLICMDADLSHPPESLPGLVRALEKDRAEMVVGSRYITGGTTDESWGLFRQLNSRVATLLARPFTNIKDPMAGFFGVPREVYERTRNWDPIGYKIGLEILVKTKCRRVQEIPIQFTDRRRGESKLSLVEQLNYLRHLGRLGRHKYQRSTELAQFTLVGASGAVLDLSLFALLWSFGFGIPFSRGLAIAAAVVWNFFGNERMTFRTGSKGAFKRFQKFAVSCSCGAAISYCVAVFGVTLANPLAAHPFVLATIGIILGSVINFLLAKHWVFAGEKPFAKHTKLGV